MIHVLRWLAIVGTIWFFMKVFGYVRIYRVSDKRNKREVW